MGRLNEASIRRDELETELTAAKASSSTVSVELETLRAQKERMESERSELMDQLHSALQRGASLEANVSRKRSRACCRTQ